MPIYEFKCSVCGNNFDKLCKVNEDLSTVECPDCGSSDVKKQLSLFCCSGSEIKSSGSGCGSCTSNKCSTCGH